jgi:hypothetical protein
MVLNSPNGRERTSIGTRRSLHSAVLKWVVDVTARWAVCMGVTPPGSYSFLSLRARHVPDSAALEADERINGRYTP